MSSNIDLRAHVRHDSIAQKRNNTPTKSKPGPSLVGGGGGGSPGRGARDGSTQGSSSSAGGLVMTPSRAVKTILIALVLFAILHFYPSSSSSGRGTTTTAKTTHEERKRMMQGSGEAWILPKKWRESENGSLEGGETLPECKRVMLFKFSNTHGFSSELLHYLRSLVIGQKLGYTVLADDSQWNYGSLSEYFLPRFVYCRPPNDWYDESKAVRLGTKRWQSKDRVWVGREMEREMDEWIREEMLDQSASVNPSTATTTKDATEILPEGETLPPSLEEVYTDFEGVLKEVWRPNHELAVLIRKQRMELGLGGGGLRHRKNSPNWGGRQRKGDRSTNQDSSTEEEDFEQEYELSIAERSDRGPVIGVHLSPPKPSLSLTSYGLSSRAKVGNLSAVFEGVGDAVKRLSRRKNLIENPGYSRSRPTLFPESSTSTLVTLTQSDELFQKFEEETISNKGGGGGIDQLYNLVQTTKSLPVEDLKQRWNEVGGLEKILKEWDQGVWNEGLPRRLKVELTRYFVRDLTTLSRFADAFIVSGSSPTGVLAILLGGEEGAIGPRDFEGGSFGGRVRSIDGHWIPTSSVKTLYG
ncbi:uncharacterized protein JCM6883_006084 [Sporobolomyces salmoneus]|uniref:uncharacterized protein n=1 Tax=Sporobolomyces salmoneus TaxID=183962 RepID=UPI0031812965